ncbi:hypothetical protein DU53_06775 [Kosmotoga sp. DU53]|nr:hypothetical protein DU53_06775 [Kosmotoga sp. DU53]
MDTNPFGIDPNSFRVVTNCFAVVSIDFVDDTCLWRKCWTTSRRLATLSADGATLAEAVRTKERDWMLETGEPTELTEVRFANANEASMVSL